MLQDEMAVLKNVVETLNRFNIQYMVTGSVAMNFYAEPRMTRDIDLVLEIQKKDVPCFVEAFKDDFYVDEDTILSAIDHESLFNIIHNRTVVKMDFIIRKSNEYRRLEFSRKREFTVDGLLINVVSPEDLILSKSHWSKDRQSDLQNRDIANLSQTVLDWQYIREWAKFLKVEKQLESFLDG